MAAQIVHLGPAVPQLPKNNLPVPHAGGTGRITFQHFTVCIARLDSPDGVIHVYEEAHRGYRWPQIFQRAIDQKKIQFPGLYLGWYHSPVNCSHCQKVSAGAFVTLSVFYTVYERDGKLVATEGLLDKEPVAPPRVVTWPPK